MFDPHTEPSPELLKAVRAAMVLRGTSLHRWSIENGVWRQNLTKALRGDWKGPRADELVGVVRREFLFEPTI